MGIRELPHEDVITLEVTIQDGTGVEVLDGRCHLKERRREKRERRGRERSERKRRERGRSGYIHNAAMSYMPHNPHSYHDNSVCVCVCVPVLPRPEKRYTEGATGHQHSSLEYTSSFP